MIRARFSSVFAFALGLGLLSGSSGSALAQAPADVEVARELFREGAAASAANDWERACAKLEQSLSLRWSPLTLHHLAVAQRESGRLVASLESFRAFVAAPQTDKSQPFVPAARADIEQLETRVGHLTIRIDPSLTGAEVTVDGELVPHAALGRPRIVDPGIRRIRLVATGYRTLETQVDLREGGAAESDLRPTPVTSEDVAKRAEGPAPAADVASGAPMRPLTLGLVIGGGVVATTGLVVGAFGLAEADGAIDGSAEADRGRAMGVAADVMVPSGVIAAGIGVILHYVLVDDTPQEASVVAPWSSGAVGGARVRF